MDYFGNLFFMHRYIVTLQHDIKDNLSELKGFDGKERALEFMLSRHALLTLLDTEGVQSSYDKLEIIGHHKIKAHPEYLVSISHTKGLGAAIISDGVEEEAVGIDVELMTREIKEGALKFFVRDDDEKMEPLTLWTRKEAAYKALDPIKEKLGITKTPLTLKDIWVRGSEFGFGNTKAPIGTLTTEAVEKDNLSYLLSTALIPKN